MLFKFGCRCQIYDSCLPEESIESDFTSASRPLIPSEILKFVAGSSSEIRKKKLLIPKHETRKRTSK